MENGPEQPQYSVWDYVKGRLLPGRYPRVELPPADNDGSLDAVTTPRMAAQPADEEGAAPAAPQAAAYARVQPALRPGLPGEAAPMLIDIAGPDAAQSSEDDVPQVEPGWNNPDAQPGLAQRVPWRTLLAFGLAWFGQIQLEPGPDRGWLVGFGLYVVAAALGVWAWWSGEWPLGGAYWGQRAEADTAQARSGGRVWRGPFLAALALLPVAFLALGNNTFTELNVSLWLGTTLLLALSLWEPIPDVRSLLSAAPGRLAEAFQRMVQGGWVVRLRPGALTGLGVGLLVAAVVLFFRFYDLTGTPPEMNSDHAEKLLDVVDVLGGQHSIFFPRNTGREPFQFYLIAATINTFRTGVSFLSMKLGTAFFGVVTVWYIFLLGQELAGRRAGLLAAFLAGVAYWPNVITRMALRFTFYPAFVAPTLFFLLRGLRTRRRTDFVMCGLSLGIGLHTYTPIRVLPILVVIAFGLFLLHRMSAGVRRQALGWLGVVVMISVAVFLPLLRFGLQEPEMFNYRGLTRLSGMEQALPGHPVSIFLQNNWKALTMFAWDNGEIWPISIPHRPALDVVSAALFYLGVALLLARLARQRNWVDAFLLFSVPFLMLPSTLSLAFPAENPALNRASGALVPVFVIIGLSLDGLARAVESGWAGKRGRWLAGGLVVVLLALASMQNYDLTFNQYRRNYAQSSWNTSEMGLVIRDFAESVGSLDTAWVLAFPHWVDTRLVGITAGNPRRDYAISVEQLPNTLLEPRPKLFLVKSDDEGGLAALKQLYPAGWAELHQSPELQGKDFWIYFVPPSAPGGAPANTVPAAAPGSPYPAPFDAPGTPYPAPLP